MGNPYKARTRTNIAPVTPEVPVGTIGALMQWVDNDKGRAKLALDVEIANESPRITLINRLREVLNG